MVNECCDILKNELDQNKNWFKSKRANGKEWIPAFLQYVDAEKCIGCGMCVKVCLGNCYELQERVINGKKKKVSVAVHPKRCLGDCHCHKVCSIPGGAMVCSPRLIKDLR